MSLPIQKSTAKTFLLPIQNSAAKKCVAADSEIGSNSGVISALLLFFCFFRCLHSPLLT